MASESDSKVPHFNFRDFLIYVIPGAVLLAALLLLAGVTKQDVKDSSGIAESLLGLLAAYLLGHAAYGPTYPLRWLLPGWKEETSEWKTDHMWVMESHPTYYYGEIFRYRNLCRMFLALVIPLLLLGAAICYRSWSGERGWAVVAAVAFSVAAVSSAYRAVRYNRRYLDQVRRCKKFDWGDEPATGNHTSTEQHNMRAPTQHPVKAKRVVPTTSAGSSPTRSP